MSATRHGPRELAEAVGLGQRELAGKIRRMIVSRASGARWQVQGHELLDGTIETRDVDVFAGVGFASRPSADEDVEAIVANVGGAGQPTIIAARQEGVRRSVAGDLEADESQVHNSDTIIRIRANGTVEIRAAGVAAVQSTLRGATYRGAEDTLFQALSTFAAAISTFAATCTGPTPLQLAALTAAATAIQAAVTAFLAGGPAYLTTVAKVQ